MKEFEARLTTDEELNKEFLFLSKGMEYLKARAMLEEVENDPDLPGVDREERARYIENAESESTQPGRGKKIRRLLIRNMPAAVLVVALLVVRSFIFTNPMDKLYDRYYEPVSREIIGAEVGGGSTEASFQSGIACYLDRDYYCAIDQLIGDPEGSFLLGISYLGLEQYEKALEPLLAFQEQHPDSPLANWYLGLAYMRLEQPDDAISQFEKLSVINNPYRIRAAKLITRLGKIEADSEEIQ
jgi:tetratricopeptide (TPR) repeat protein